MCLEALEDELIVQFMKDLYEDARREVLEELLILSLLDEAVDDHVSHIAEHELEDMIATVHHEQASEDEVAYQSKLSCYDKYMSISLIFLVQTVSSRL
jgi:hypothetical protein